MSYGGASYGGAAYAGAGGGAPVLPGTIFETNAAVDAITDSHLTRPISDSNVAVDAIATPRTNRHSSLNEANVAVDSLGSVHGTGLTEHNAAIDALSITHIHASAALAESNRAVDAIFTSGGGGGGGPTFTATATATNVALASVATSATPMPPAPTPVPGETGFHRYEVIVCDKYGVAFGQINSAVPTEIEWVLDQIGEALIDFYILDPTALILPISVFPGVREIQIWRDGQLIWWGWPTSCTFDAKQVHLTCAGLLYPFSQRSFGPITRNYMLNPSFEEPVPADTSDVPEWTATDCAANVVGSVAAEVPLATTPLLGGFMVQLIQLEAGQNAYLGQTTTFVEGGSIGLAFDLSAWVYIDPNSTFAPAFGQGGLYVQLIVDEVVTDEELQQITVDTPVGQWVRLETSISIPPNQTGVLEVRLYAPQGVTYWDAVNLTVQESVGSPPNGADVQFIMDQVVTYAQDPTRGKSDLAIPFAGALTGTSLIRDYQFYDNAGVLDALNEFPTIGICDFEVIWDATGHYRQFQIYSPAKGLIQYNYTVEIDLGNITDLEGGIDGTQVATTVRFLGQGSSGSSEDIGYASFPSNLGGKTDGTGTLTLGSTTVSTTDGFFTAADVGQPLYCLTPGALPVGTTITEVIDSNNVVITNNNGTGAGLTLENALIGVGGIVLDSVQSGLADQPIGTLASSALGYLLRQLQPQFLPTSRQRADGPNGLFGNVGTGDILPVMFNYGWLTFGPVLMRIASLTLYPPTEELEVQLNPVPIGQNVYS